MMSATKIDGDALAEYVTHFRARVLQDAIAEAVAATWERRAATFEAARPRPGDFTGRKTAEQVREHDAELAAVALACRERAAVSLLGGAHV